jgi:KUP system potassium uptake protein
VVYGDIGTSPLYALKESLAAATDHAGATALTREMVLGVVSLILWTLIIIVTIKYVAIVLRADNNGEGGTLSLVTLAQRALGHSTGATIIVALPLTLRFVALGVDKRYSLPLKVRCRSGLFAAP